MRKTLLRTNITVLYWVYIQCRRLRPTVDCILSFFFPAETDVLVPVFSQSTDVVVVNFVVVLKFPNDDDDDDNDDNNGFYYYDDDDDIDEGDDDDDGDGDDDELLIFIQMSSIALTLL